MFISLLCSLFLCYNCFDMTCSLLGHDTIKFLSLSIPGPVHECKGSKHKLQASTSNAQGGREKKKRVGRLVTGGCGELRAEAVLEVWQHDLWTPLK